MLNPETIIWLEGWATQDGQLPTFIRLDPRFFPELSSRELEVLSHVIVGKKTREIAPILGISDRTVEVHRLTIEQRMKAANTPELILLALLRSIGRISVDTVGTRSTSKPPVKRKSRAASDGSVSP